jgi:hypothetical protein
MARPKFDLDPAFRNACLDVLKTHRGRGNVYSGGTGVSCFVWVTGVSTRPGSYCRALLGSFDLDLRDGKVYDALRAIPGYRDATINID